MRRFSLLAKIISSYFLAGFLNLGFMGIYIILTHGNLGSQDLSLLSSILLWPISSFASAKKILGPDQGHIWNWFNFSTIILFLCLIASFVKRNTSFWGGKK